MEQNHNEMRTQQLETLGLIASGIAHDFNNLLTSILGQSSLALANLPPGNTARKHIEKAMEAAEFATALTHQLLDFVSDKSSPVQQLDLNAILRDNASLLGMSLLDGVMLQFELAPNLPTTLLQRTQIQQLIMNLIMNAAESIRQPSGAVTVRTGRRSFLNQSAMPQFVNGRTLSPGDYLYLQVQDTGTGMDAQTLAHIFTPFFSTKERGRGLGLATLLEITEQHHGAIQVQSAPGCGTTFTVYFPIVDARQTVPSVEPA